MVKKSFIDEYVQIVNIEKNLLSTIEKDFQNLVSVVKNTLIKISAGRPFGEYYIPEKWSWVFCSPHIVDIDHDEIVVRILEPEERTLRSLCKSKRFKKRYHKWKENYIYLDLDFLFTPQTPLAQQVRKDSYENFLHLASKSYGPHKTMEKLMYSRDELQKRAHLNLYDFQQNINKAKEKNINE